MNFTAQQQEMFDRMLIREQIDNYIDALNHRDWDRIAETMCEDIHWSAAAPFNQEFRPKSAFVEMLKTVQEYQFGFVFQMGHGIVIREIKGNSARACQTLEIFGSNFHTIGLYYDELRKEDDGVWRFLRRDFRPTYHVQRNVPGDIYRQLPDPDYRSLPHVEAATT